MTATDKLASSLNRRDELPNISLAKEIVAAYDAKAVEELADNLAHRDKNIQSDSIKVLYEIGNIDPSLIAPYANELIALLDSDNNRLQWGAMTALDSIAEEKPALIYKALAKLAAVAEHGSVITKDHYIAILTKLCAIKEYAAHAFKLLNEQLLLSATNQLPMYAENALPVISKSNIPAFAQTLTKRLPDIERESKRRRIEKILKKLQGE